MNSNTNYNIYQISQQIQEERLHLYQQQAKQIVNAYRKVEQIKTEHPNPIKKQPKPQHEYKPTSNYAAKVKETLKQINAAKTKQSKGIIKLSNEVHLPNKKNRQQQKLLNVGLSNLFSFVQDYQKLQLKKMWQTLVRYAHEEIERQNYFIMKYRKYRIFRAWKDEFILMQIQNKNNQQGTIPSQAQQLAVQFRTFTLLKKSFAQWKSYSKKEAKRKHYEKQLIRKDLAINQQKKNQLAIKQQKKSEPKTLIKQNHELQSKVRNFVGKLKEQIQNKDRLITIKENTEQSQLHNKPADLQEIRAEAEEEEYNESQQIQQVHDNEIVIRPPNFEDNLKNNKQMTNQQLQKKRKQLEMKHKGRKQALQKLRKEKEQKKKQQEMQRKQLQKQMEAEEKRIKQEKYKDYLRSKKEQQEWQLKEKQLQIKANNFNLYRLKKFYGWLQLVNAKKLKKQRILTLYQTILSIVYRIKSNQFIVNTQQICNQAIELAYERVKKKYRKNLLRKGLLCLFSNRQLQTDCKQQLFIRHEVNLLKIFYSAWKRVIPLLRDQNVEWQLPRKKRADHFYSLQLLHKGIQSLRTNKEQQQRDRLISQQKVKIKNKIRNMLQDQAQINYAQFL